MMIIYNSSFEISLRIIVVLDTYGIPLSLDSIKQIDMLSTYCKNYGIEDSNLNGDSPYTISEIATRRDLIKEALKLLVLQGYVDIISSKQGFLYSINKLSKEIHRQMSSDYAAEYEDAVKCVKNKISRMPSTDINTLLYHIEKESLI